MYIRDEYPEFFGSGQRAWDHPLCVQPPNMDDIDVQVASAFACHRLPGDSSE